MSEWRQEFQYLLDMKILSRDELGYLFGQIKSIVDGDTKQLKSKAQGAEHYIYNLLAEVTNNKYGPYDPPRKNLEKPQWLDALKKEIATLQAELTKFHEAAQAVKREE